MWNMRLDEETRKRWEDGARLRGYASLPEFVKACVEAELDRDASQGARATERPSPLPSVPPPLPVTVVSAPGGKRTFKPDFKKGTK